ncbi:MAG: hypothetical protein ACE5I1_19550 [bacterium]
MPSTTAKTTQEIQAQTLDESNNAQRVNVVAGSAGSTQYAEDSVHNSGDSGTMALAVRKDTGAAIAGTDGDYSPLQVDSGGALRVTGGGGGTEYNDGDARGVATGTIVMGDDGTNIQSLACGTDGVLKTDINSALPAGANAIGTLASNSGVDIGDVTINNASGASAVNIQDGGNVLSVDDAGGSLTVDGPLTDTELRAASVEVEGDAAHDAAIAGNPVRTGARAQTSDFTAVASGDTVDSLATTTGKRVTYPFALPGQSWSYAAASGGITNTTGVTIKAAGGAGIRNYITDLQVINGHASTSTDVQIRDGAAGTVLWRGFAQAGGGGISCHFNTPIRGAANTLLEVACGTTGAAVYVNAQGFTAAE